MVRKGEFLERSVVVKHGDLTLDALYHRGREHPPCVLAAPHPAMGGSMTSPVISELAWALTRSGNATMRFNYRGVGASHGVSRHPANTLRTLSPTDLDDERADLFAVGDQLLATTGAPAFCAIGYSFGSTVVMTAVDDPRVERLVLVAPPTEIFDFSAVAGVTKPLLVVAAHRDEYTDRAALQALMPAGARFEVIANADHFFLRGLTELGKLVSGWVRGDRPAPAAAADPDADSEVREIELDPGDDEPLELDLDRK